MSVKLRISVPFFLLLFVALGCGTKGTTPATVSGKVSYKGATVTGGTLAFHTKEGVFSRPLSAEGTYSVDLPVGEHVVTVETESANTGKKKEDYKGGSRSKGGAGPTVPKSGKGAPSSPMPEGFTPVASGAYVEIPPKYADAKTSTLRVTVESGSQTRNFELEP